MKLHCFLITIIVLVLNPRLICQNLDLGILNPSGKHHEMAGAGIGNVQGIQSIALNPAGLANTQKISLSLGLGLHYYSYSLTNQRQEKYLTRIFDWGKVNYNIVNVLTAIPIGKKITLGAGVIQRMNPFIYNQKRAITWSILFNQTTTGSMYALTFASGFQLSERFSFGVSLFQYFGKTTSDIRGDNHGNDADKWVWMENNYRGINFRLGGKAQFEKFNVSVVFELPTDLQVKTKHDISDEKLYESLLPNYDQTTLSIPLILGVGFTYTLDPEWTFTLDIESRRYKKSNIKINLFEYGGNPNWKDVNIFRFGVKYLSSNQPSLPIRFGYAYIPQLYASIEAIGTGSAILEYKDIRQNIKHLFSSGTTVSFSQFDINFGVEYSFIEWHRDFYTYIHVVDDYIEKNYVLFSEIVYHFD